MKIGELSKRSAKSIYTIRWYEAQRLIPGVRRDSGGRRIYSAWHADWLQYLDRLRKSGMTIRTMREYTALVRKGDSTLAERCELLLQHREGVAARLSEMERALELVDRKVAYYRDWLETGKRGIFPGGSG